METLPIVEIAAQLASDVDRLVWHTPSHVYNPLRYAWGNHRTYLERYGSQPGRILMVGMNPGPWGMAQTGVPFGDVVEVRDWLHIDHPIQGPLPEQHPNYPLLGMDCHRREGSGRRLWGWARSRFPDADDFFRKAFVWNYCPLLFIQHNRNLVPEKLSRNEQQALVEVCNTALTRVVHCLQPRMVVGIGRYAQARLRDVLGADAQIEYLLHPSPANPNANRHWAAHADELFESSPPALE